MTRRQRGYRSYWSNPNATMSLGCVGCFDLKRCGGQTTDGPGFNCLDHCCHQPEVCEVVCPNSRVFADRIREVQGLDLQTPAAAKLQPPECPTYLPLLFHGSARASELVAPAVAFPLYQFFDRAAECRFGSREEIARVLKVRADANVFLSGVAQDREVERWWKLETNGRLKAIANLRRLGIGMVTTPNFSLMVDRPRWDDLHSVKRIAEVYHEFVSEGQPAALHVNGRTRYDFLRWADYISAHTEVTHIAFEFTTGAKSPVRMRQHAAWLIELASHAGRQLGLVLRGGVQVVPELALHYDITFMDSSPFGKAQHREIAFIDSNRDRRWTKHPTRPGAPLDALLQENIRVSELWFAGIVPKFAVAA